MAQKAVKKKSARAVYGVVVSEFNSYITQRLLDGCLEELKRQGVPDSCVRVVRVPGALEIPVAALRLAKKRPVSAVITLGCVIRGETYHFELVADNAARGVARAALDTLKPVIFGVITTETVEQAYKRSGDGDEHKGREAAQAALAMVRVFDAL